MVIGARHSCSGCCPGLIYAQAHKAVPSSLDVLPKREGYVNRTTDSWNRPLQYHIADDGMLTLTSYGADGKPGGTGEDADISVSYHSTKPDGSLWVGSSMWTVEGEVQRFRAYNRETAVAGKML